MFDIKLLFLVWQNYSLYVFLGKTIVTHLGLSNLNLSNLLNAKRYRIHKLSTLVVLSPFNVINKL